MGEQPRYTLEGLCPGDRSEIERFRAYLRRLKKWDDENADPKGKSDEEIKEMLKRRDKAQLEIYKEIYGNDKP